MSNEERQMTHLSQAEIDVATASVIEAEKQIMDSLDVDLMDRNQADHFGALFVMAFTRVIRARGVPLTILLEGITESWMALEQMSRGISGVEEDKKPPS